MGFLETLCIKHYILVPCMILAMILAKKKFAWLLFAAGPAIEIFACMGSYSMMMAAGYSNAVAYHLAPILLWSAIGATVIAVRRRRIPKNVNLPEGTPTWTCSECGQKNMEKAAVCQCCGVTRQWSENKKKEAQAAAPKVAAPPVEVPVVPHIPKPVESPARESVIPPVRKPAAPANVPMAAPQKPVAPAVQPPVRPVNPVVPEDTGKTVPLGREISEIEELPATLPVNRKPVTALLCLRTGPMAGANFQCAQGRGVVIGRDPSRCTLALKQYPSVSGVHCRVEVGDQYVTVTDLNSSNGTFVNGGRLQPNKPAVVKAGGTFKLATDECVFLVYFEK